MNSKILQWKKNYSRALVGGLNDESSMYNVRGRVVNLASECGNVCNIRNVCEDDAKCFSERDKLKTVIISGVGCRWDVILATQVDKESGLFIW